MLSQERKHQTKTSEGHGNIHRAWPAMTTSPPGIRLFRLYVFILLTPMSLVCSRTDWFLKTGWISLAKFCVCAFHLFVCRFAQGLGSEGGFAGFLVVEPLDVRGWKHWPNTSGMK